MIRVVVDTNVLVSALLRPNGPPAEVLLALNSRTIQSCLSGAIFAEYEEVLRRPKLKRSPEEIEQTLEAMRRISLWVRPQTKVNACADADDNAFLECAEAARADFVVTGNLRHFPERWKETLIVTPTQLLATLERA